MKGNILSVKLQLTEKLVERGLFVLGRRIVCNGVQAGLYESAITVKKGIEPSGPGMFFK